MPTIVQKGAYKMARKPLTKNQKVILQVLGILVGLTGAALGGAMVGQELGLIKGNGGGATWTVAFISLFLILVGVELVTFRITRWSGPAMGGLLKRFTGAAGGTADSEVGTPTAEDTND